MTILKKNPWLRDAVRDLLFFQKIREPFSVPISYLITIIALDGVSFEVSFLRVMFRVAKQNIRSYNDFIASEQNHSTNHLWILGK